MAVCFFDFKLNKRVLFQNTHNIKKMENPPRIPDLGFVEISKDQLINRFGTPTIQLLSNKKTYPPEFFDFALPWPQNYSNAYAHANPLWTRLAEFPTIGQDHPAWMTLRTVMPLSISASRLHAFLLMGHGITGKELELSPGMCIPEYSVSQSETQYDPTWNTFYLKAIEPRMPGYPDDIFSHAFMLGGVKNENGVLNTFLSAHEGEFVYRDQGSTFITPEILERCNLTNLITKERIRSLPFLMSASPDGLIKRRDNPQAEWMTCEWKAATMFLPVGKEYPGIEFFFQEKTKPYKTPKNYYKPQIAVQQLVCETQSTMFGCWTLFQGMRVWRIERNNKYLSLMLTLLIHLFERFMNPKTARESDLGKVPICYFTKPELCGQDVFILYKEFKALTLAFGSEPECENISGDFCTEATKKTLGLTTVPRPRYITFPNVYPEVPNYFITNIFAKYFIGTEKYGSVWIKTPKDIELRLKTLQYLFSMRYSKFLMGGDKPVPDHEPNKRAIELCPQRPFNFIKRGVLMLQEHGFPVENEEMREHLACKAYVLDKMEKYMNFSLFLLYRIHCIMKAYNVQNREYSIRTYIDQLNTFCCGLMLKDNAAQKGDSMDLDAEADDDEEDAETKVSMSFVGPGPPVPDKDFGMKDIRWHIVALKEQVPGEDDCIQTQRSFATIIMIMRLFKCKGRDVYLKQIENYQKKLERDIAQATIAGTI
jgi:hypothetical protein